MAADHYQILSVSRKATPEQIRARYLALLKEFREKLGTGKPEDPARLAEIRAAYQVLSDSTARLRYDEARRAVDDTALAAKSSGLLARACGGRIRAWKIFWLFLVPGLALALGLGSATGRVALLLLLVVVHAWVITLAVVVAVVIPLAGAIMLWRSAFNARARIWGYLNRSIAVLSVLTVAAVGVRVMPVLGISVGTPAAVSGQPFSRTKQTAPNHDKEYASKTPGESLLLGARYGDRGKVEKLLAQGVDIHTRETARQNAGRTALHYAAGGMQYAPRGSHLDVARLLIAKGADPNAKADGGYTPLHVASGLGQREMVELLLEAGSDPNAVDVRGAPLHAAVLQGHKAVVELLITKGAKVDGADANGVRPLDVLGNIGTWYPAHDEIAKVLVKNGASLTKGDRANARSALEVAVLHDRKTLAMFYIDQGAPIDDAVVAAVGTYGHKEVAEYLLDKKVLAFDRAEPGTTFLHGAACFNGSEFFDWVLANTKNVNHPDKNGKTPLHRAAACGKADYLTKLLAKGGDVRAKDAKGRTALGELSGSSRIEAVRTLVRAGADPNEPKPDGSTVLMAMVYSNDADAVQFLVDNGANINVRNRGGNTALHEAARLNKADAAKALLAVKQIKINEPNNSGRTPLHLAAESGAPQVVRLLLEKGADRSVMAADGKTALQLAEQRGPAWQEIVQLLK